MKRIFIWLDDERPIPEEWINAANDDVYLMKSRCAKNLITWFETDSSKFDKIFISFDHDLGGSLTGYDVTKHIVENKYNLTGFTVHSMNPVGAVNIIDLLTHYGYYKMNYRRDINTK